MTDTFHNCGKASCRVFLFLACSMFLWAGLAGASFENDIIGRTKILTSNELAGRGSGTEEVYAAGEILAGWFKDLGLEPGFGGTWFQEFPLSGNGWTGDDLTGKMGRNIAAILPGEGPLSEQYIVVGAHYDHLGRLVVAPEGAAPPSDGEYYAGANDNASGLTVLFEMAALAVKGDFPTEAPSGGRRSLLFFCFAAEEVGLQGSGYLASHMPVPLDQVTAMINFDTVGQLSDNRLYVSGVGTAAALTEIAKSANSVGFDLSLAQGGWSGSDHMSFNTKEVPVLFIFGGPYRQYNTPDDVWSTLQPESLTKVATYGFELMSRLAVYEEDLSWIMVAEKVLRPTDGAAQNKNTWFGSLPDFTDKISGYKLGGIFDGSPADKAGLRKGDIIIKLAGHDVTDLPTFTTSLRRNEPGDVVEVTILRDGNPLNFTVVLGDRSQRK